MWRLLRVLLRFAAVVLLAVAVYLIVWAPKANVASADLVTKVSVTVQCSSVWDQWTHHAQPAALQVNGTSVTNLAAAQSSCQSASHTIKEAGAALTAGAVVALGVSLIPRRARR
ncbi:MAG TPA: hypothetical protein VG298_11970 [Acidimicrobiales bacterium]|jgi:hypothetical protein|nr:hypothetical protein [Acidimicrobiales bacterium]